MLVLPVLGVIENEQVAAARTWKDVEQLPVPPTPFANRLTVWDPGGKPLAGPAAWHSVVALAAPSYSYSHPVVSAEAFHENWNSVVVPPMLGTTEIVQVGAATTWNEEEQLPVPPGPVAVKWSVVEPSPLSDPRNEVVPEQSIGAGVPALTVAAQEVVVPMVLHVEVKLEVSPPMAGTVLI